MFYKIEYLKQNVENELEVNKMYIYFMILNKLAETVESPNSTLNTARFILGKLMAIILIYYHISILLEKESGLWYSTLKPTC